jgi:hypothetical protein
MSPETAIEVPLSLVPKDHRTLANFACTDSIARDIETERF